MFFVSVLKGDRACIYMYMNCLFVIIEGAYNRKEVEADAIKRKLLCFYFLSLNIVDFVV